MTEFDKDAVQSWQTVHYNSKIYEERPYRECPNCNKHKFRAVKRSKGGLLTVRRTTYTERCSNCKYVGEEWTETHD